jgi:CRISPR-associated protein Cmr2
MSKLIDKQTSPSAHRAVSVALAGFASIVRSIVEGQYKGSLVYAGGDDVLAFLPLHNALACARELADQFKHQLSKLQAAMPVSLSVGLAVAHHHDPLSDTLSSARDAERTAKNRPGKNSLAITVSKRSGEEQTVSGAWESFDVRLNRFITFYRREVDAIPDNAAYELRDLALRLGPAAGSGIDKTLDEAMRFEAKRILQRKHTSHGTREVGRGVLLEVAALIESPDLSISQIADELIVARTFAEAADIAGMLLEGE